MNPDEESDDSADEKPFHGFPSWYTIPKVYDEHSGNLLQDIFRHKKDIDEFSALNPIMTPDQKVYYLKMQQGLQKLEGELIKMGDLSNVTRKSGSEGNSHSEKREVNF